MVINDPLQLVIVRDMWLTRLDAPNCHTMYIDKPMKGHNLRMNRVFKDKPDGLVVDYIGIANELKHALKSYMSSQGKCKPTIDKSPLGSSMGDIDPAYHDQILLVLAEIFAT